MTPEDFKSFNQNRAIQAHIASLIERHRFDFYVTVTFAHGLYGPFRRCHIADAERMVRGYANKLKKIQYGKRAKEPKDFLFACWFEDKDRMKATVPLHAHILLSYHVNRVEELNRETNEYWRKVGANSPHRFIPSIDIRSVYDVAYLADYNGKNTEDGLTIESLILFGLS